MLNAVNGFPIPAPPAAPAAGPSGSASTAAAGSPLFGNLLLQSLGQVNALDQSAQGAVEKAFTGDDVSQVEVLTSMKKADLALRLMVQIRNKIMDAYSEIRQMQM